MRRRIGQRVLQRQQLRHVQVARVGESLRLGLGLVAVRRHRLNHNCLLAATLSRNGHGDTCAAALRRVRPAGREDPRRLLQGRVLHLHAGRARAGRAPPAGADAGLPAPSLGARRHGRGHRHPARVLGPTARRRLLGARLGRSSRCARCTTATTVEPWETVLTIEGDYGLFAHLETLYLGSLARRTLISRNVREVVDAARGKPILYFPARFDHWPRPDRRRLRRPHRRRDRRVDRRPGLVVGRARDRHRAARPDRGLRRGHRGRRRGLRRTMPEELDIVVLVDFENDSVRTALEVADALGPRLWGVRLDTSNTLVDRSLWLADGPLRPARRRTRSSSGTSAGRSTRPATGTSDRRLRRLHADKIAAFEGRACRSTPTASAPR